MPWDVTNQMEVDMDKSTQSELLDSIADYADVVSGATESEQSKSMSAAFALDTLYEQGDWVDEWLEESPKPKNPRSFQADSRNRFAKWVEWRETERNRPAPVNQTVYRLLAAVEVVKDTEVQGFTKPENRRNLREGHLRPLRWLYKQRRVDRVPEVWQRAVVIAGTQDQITEKIVKQALSEFKTEVLGAGAKGLKPVKVDRRARQVSHWRMKHDQLVREISNFGAATVHDDEGWIEWEEFESDVLHLLEEAKKIHAENRRLRAV